MNTKPLIGLAVLAAIGGLVMPAVNKPLTAAIKSAVIAPAVADGNTNLRMNLSEINGAILFCGFKVRGMGQPGQPGLPDFAVRTPVGFGKFKWAYERDPVGTCNAVRSRYSDIFQ